MTTYTFKIVVEPDEDRWRAYQPELEAQGAATWGYTRDEALQNIREVLEMIVAELVEEGRPVPANVSVSEEPLVAVTVLSQIEWRRLRNLTAARSLPLLSATALCSTISAVLTNAIATPTGAGLPSHFTAPATLFRSGRFAR